MKHIPLSFFAASVALSASAVDLSGLADIRFAESYAFSTNRTALIETLRPNTKAWFVYSILDAQVDGRLDDADKILEKWNALAANSPEWDNARFNALRDRQCLLRFDRNAEADRMDLWDVRNVLIRAGVDWDTPPRETELKPNTYPSVLDPKELSYAELRKRSHIALDDKYAFIDFLENPDGEKEDAYGAKLERRALDGLLPDTPGLYTRLVAYMKSCDT